MRTWTIERDGVKVAVVLALLDRQHLKKVQPAFSAMPVMHQCWVTAWSQRMKLFRGVALSVTVDRDGSEFVVRQADYAEWRSLEVPMWPAVKAKGKRRGKVPEVVGKEVRSPAPVPPKPSGEMRHNPDLDAVFG